MRDLPYRVWEFSRERHRRTLRAWRILLTTFVPITVRRFPFPTPQDETQAVNGTGHGENTLRQHGGRQFLGMIRLRAHHFREAQSPLWRCA